MSTRTPGLAVQLAAAGYLLLLIYLTFAPLPPPDLVAGRGSGLNLVPFESIVRALHIGPPSRAFWLLVGNVVAFVPVGILLPLLAPRRTTWLLVLATGAGLSMLIELGQLSVSLLVGVPYRIAEVDDVILNTVGALTGYALYRPLRTLAARVA